MGSVPMFLLCFSGVTEEGCISVLHGYTPTAPGQAAQPCFESIYSFFSGSQLHPCERETQKGTVLSTKDFAFVPVDLNLYVPFVSPQKSSTF
jgi:hypothetical protein